jgi:hypothetical protein
MIRALPPGIVFELTFIIILLGVVDVPIGERINERLTAIGMTRAALATVNRTR